MRASAAALLIAFCVVGCLDRDDPDKYALTPDGYRVRWYDQGSVSSGLATMDQRFAEFDAAMISVRAYFQTTYGFDPESGAKEHGFWLHDNLWFWYEGYRTTGYHYDFTDPPQIGVAFWSYGSSMDPADIPAGAQPWTVYQGTTTGLWYWGIDNPANRYPALAHELEHHWGLVSHKAGADCPGCRLNN